jgi:A/G-specific adenine glycosylase
MTSGVCADGLRCAFKMDSKKFQKTIWHYYARNKREMPWRNTKDPYRILVSEIMLQQTQVDRVRGFYKNFIRRFPDFSSLARARTSEVLRFWQGLGYNRRALALQRSAQMIIKDHSGKLPKSREVLESLPGIGRGTSGSLAAFVFNEPVAFIETNIRRVFIHFFFKGRDSVSDEEILPFVLKTLPVENPREWYWALMDYGSMLGAQKMKNPNMRSRHYMRQPRFSGSDREIRGKLLRLLLGEKKLSRAKLFGYFPGSPDRVERIVKNLITEGFIAIRGNMLSIKEKHFL